MEEDLEIGQVSLPQGLTIVFTLGNRPQNNSAELYLPLWFQFRRTYKIKIVTNQLLFDNPGLAGQEPRTPFIFQGEKGKRPIYVFNTSLYNYHHDMRYTFHHSTIIMSTGFCSSVV